MNIIEGIYDGLKLDRLTMDRLTHKIKNKVPLKSGRAIREIYEQPSIAAPELDILIIGARWGPYTPLQNIKWLSDPNIIGVEPDTEECYRLNKKYPECNFYPIALGNKTGQSQLYLTKKRSRSSIYKPNYGLLKDYGYEIDEYKLDEEVQIQTTTLDKFIHEKDFKPDVIQIDAQGAEGDIITGGYEAISQSVGLNVELHTIERYRGIDTFWDIHDELSNTHNYNLVKASEWKRQTIDCCYLTQDNITNSSDVLKSVLISLLFECNRQSYHIWNSNKEQIPSDQFNLVSDILRSTLPNDSHS